VKLEPEELFFNNFVTLMIAPLQELPIDQQIFFGYQADGEELTLASPVNDSFEFKVPDCSVSSNRGGSTFEGLTTPAC
jgi:hypothetical protein